MTARVPPVAFALLPAAPVAEEEVRRAPAPASFVVARVGPVADGDRADVALQVVPHAEPAGSPP